jgi:transcription-repair coupling factor (superfamily II helicase)
MSVDHLEEIARTVEASLGDTGMLLRGGSHFAVRAEEEVHSLVIAALFRRGKGPLLAVAPGRDAVDDLERSLALLLGEERVKVVPFRELVIAGERGEDPESVALRARALHALHRGRKEIMVCEARFLVRETTVDSRSVRPLRLSVGENRAMEEVLENLHDMGYERDYLVEGAGRFAVRGGILDVYDPGHPYPVRVEFFGDEVERIRFFDPVDQRSRVALDGVEIYPVRVEEGGGGTGSILDLLPRGGTVAVMHPREAWEKAAAEGAAFDPVRETASRGLNLVELDPLSSHPAAEVRSLGVMRYGGRVARFIEDLKKLVGRGWKCLLLLETEGRVERMKEILLEEGVPLASEGGMREGVVLLRRGFWPWSFKLPDARTALFTDAAVFGGMRRRGAAAGRFGGQPVEGWWDLEIGDYVVHVNHGIAVYGGLVKKKAAGGEREYLLLKYGGGDMLYVPTDRVDLVHRYVGAEKPQLHRLSSSHWRRVTRRARSSARRMAFDLLKLYAERMAGEGHAFSPDDPWQRELESSFPYVETPDQERAIREVKEDMEKPVPMDRLVYGDVGFGKTEVAVRAAFKAVMDGKQVAVLVPTTILAQQHYRTFRERFAPFPVRLEVLSRFRSPAEQKKVLEGLASGEVDVVIGTHRLLQEDVRLADLGLLIVDEEHRFGVAQKEKLKALRRSVDVLTLTATPIPRTLQMSLSGIRDMSVMETPIENRQAVITSVGPWDDRLVQEAIRRELQREGQVFFVHNRVKTIQAAAEKVRRLVPEARVVVGHGRMKEDRLERVMEEFISRRADVLVCTTIVESGLDIPNVNTLIVDGAENLGLAQLYHLRGRIGRGDRQAYAFFLFGRGGSVGDGALQRLKVIRDFSELGSGIRVAMKDLEIRGAGNLLGPEQHGHVEAVGFEMYCRMLADAVEALKGKKRPRLSEVNLDLPMRAFLPDVYVSRSSRRLEIYRRLVEATKEEEVESLREEVRDRYGPLPPEAENIFALAGFRLKCIRAGVKEVGHAREGVVLRLGPEGERGSGFFLEEARSGGYPWKGVRYRRALREVVLEIDPSSWPVEGRRNLEALGRLLDAVAVRRGGGKGRARDEVG